MNSIKVDSGDAVSQMYGSDNFECATGNANIVNASTIMIEIIRDNIVQLSDNPCSRPRLRGEYGSDRPQFRASLMRN